MNGLTLLQGSAKKTCSRLLTCCLFAGLLAACTSQVDPDHQALAEHEAGIRLLAKQPIVYVKTVPSISLAARDYLLLLPIESYNNNRWSANLWVGVASTIDPSYQPKQTPSMVELTIDGEQVRVPLQNWPVDVQQPIATKLPVYLAMQAVLDDMLLKRLANAAQVTFSLHTDSKSTKHYAHWRGQWPQDYETTLSEPVELAAKAHQPPIVQ